MECVQDAGAAMAVPASENLRPLCLHPEACKCVGYGKHCRGCVASANNRDPVKRAKCSAAMRKRHQDPVFRKQVAARAREVMANLSPEERERRRQVGYQRVSVLQRPDVVAANMAPEKRAAAGKKITAHRLAWCPEPYRAEYMALVRRHHYTAAEARKLIKAQIRADARTKRAATSAMDRAFQAAEGHDRPERRRHFSRAITCTLGGVSA